MENLYFDLSGDQYTEEEAIQFLGHFEHVEYIIENEVQDSEKWMQLYLKNKEQIDAERP